MQSVTYKSCVMFIGLPGMPGAPQNPPTVPPRNQWSLSSPDAELSSTQPINSVHMASVSNNDPFSTTG